MTKRPIWSIWTNVRGLLAVRSAIPDLKSPQPESLVRQRIHRRPIPLLPSSSSSTTLPSEAARRNTLRSRAAHFPNTTNGTLPFLPGAIDLMSTYPLSSQPTLERTRAYLPFRRPSAPTKLVLLHEMSPCPPSYFSRNLVCQCQSQRHLNSTRARGP